MKITIKISPVDKTDVEMKPVADQESAMDDMLAQIALGKTNGVIYMCPTGRSMNVPYKWKMEVK